MHCYGQPYGHLALKDGEPMPLPALCKLLFASKSYAKNALNAVLRTGIWQQTKDGVLFDPELIASFALSQKNYRNGIKGGNPNLKPVNPPDNQSVNPPDNQSVNPPDNQSVNLLSRARSVSVSVSGSEEGYGEDGVEVDNASLDFAAAGELLRHLCQQCGTQYPESPGNLHLAAMALHVVGQDLAGARETVTLQVGVWGSDPMRRPWLRPSTLFARERFVSLYAERHGAVKTGDKTGALRAELARERNPEERARIRAEINNMEAQTA